MFEKEYIGINDINNNPIHNGMIVKILDKDIIGDVRYSYKRLGFRIFTGNKKPHEAKTYSLADNGKDINVNLLIIE